MRPGIRRSSGTASSRRTASGTRVISPRSIGSMTRRCAKRWIACIRVVGVQSEGAPAVYRSWREGRRVVTDCITTFAEGLATREPFDMPLALFPKLVDDMMLVDDDRIAAAVRLVLETARQVAEGAGAAAVAGALERRGELAGKTVGIVLSGGNITADQLRRILNHERP